MHFDDGVDDDGDGAEWDFLRRHRRSCSSLAL
jgi:hypothetical protein